MSDIYIPQKEGGKSSKLMQFGSLAATAMGYPVAAAGLGAGSMLTQDSGQSPQEMSQGDAISRRIENYGTDQNILAQALKDVEQLPTPYRDKFRTPIYQAYMKSQQQG